MKNILKITALSALHSIYLTGSAQLSSLKFDVELELDHLVVNNVKDFDKTEDLSGAIYFFSLKAKSKENDKDVRLWYASLMEPLSLRDGKYEIDKRIRIIQNLSYDELKNVELKVTGSVSDSEGLYHISFDCVECPVNDRHLRKLKFIEMPTTQASIGNLRNNGVFQMLKFGEDQFFELNFYESGIKTNGWVKFLFKVWVKPN